jgi:hypothetical protein
MNLLIGFLVALRRAPRWVRYIFSALPIFAAAHTLTALFAPDLRRSLLVTYFATLFFFIAILIYDTHLIAYLTRRSPARKR